MTWYKAFEREEIEKKIAEMEAGIEELKKELERVEDSNPDVFTPKQNEKYLTIQSGGNIFSSYWNDEVIDEDRLAIGNVFRTVKEAEFEVERLKVINELRMYAEPRNIKWDGEKKHFSMIYNLKKEEIFIYATTWWKENDIYFSSKDKAWEAIKKVGEERVKKYYLCVEEEEEND